jgi:ABC-type dipeptide/oligopeptide/nickel transport system permease subunit
MQIATPSRSRAAYPFGADNLGRDVYSQVVHGARFCC